MKSCMSYVMLLFVFCLFVFSTDMHVMLQVLALGGRIGVACAFCLIFVFYTELMPTVVRNMGFGITCTAGLIGSILCPYILYLGKYFILFYLACWLLSCFLKLFFVRY